MRSIKPLIGALLIIALLIGVYFATRGKPYAGESAIKEANAVVLKDQPKESPSYTVSYAKLSKPGFVVVYSVDQTGRRSVAGRSDLLDAGEYVNLRINKVAVSGRSTTYIEGSALADNGDGFFDETTDTEVLFDGVAGAHAQEYTFAESPYVNSASELAALLAESGFTLNTHAEEVLQDAIAISAPPPDQAAQENTATTSASTPSASVSSQTTSSQSTTASPPESTPTVANQPTTPQQPNTDSGYIVGTPGYTPPATVERMPSGSMMEVLLAPDQ